MIDIGCARSLPSPPGPGVAPVAIGAAMRAQRGRADREAALHRARAARRAADERARISHDVHDIVGHHLCAIRMQAVGARHADRAAHPALGTIADLSAEALGEIRHLLDLLDGGEPGPVYARLADVETLARRMSGDRPRVRTHLPGPDRALPPLVEHCAYRIVQEALTNAVRHSRAGTVDVRVTAMPDALLVQVDDDGAARPGEPPAAPGHGIRGMTDRARLVGGVLTAGPREPAGWRVGAVLPLGWDAASDAGSDAGSDMGSDADAGGGGAR